MDRQKYSTRFVLNFDVELVSAEQVVDEALNDPAQPWAAYLNSNILDHQIPDRMVVEILGRHLERRILQGQKGFLIDGFPKNETQAAIFEEDVSSQSFCFSPKKSKTLTNTGLPSQSIHLPPWPSSENSSTI